MPEGPEVETIRRGLELGAVGQVVKGVEVYWRKSLLADDALLKKAVVGATITRASRRAKVLVLDLSSGYSLLFHLKMTGQLVLIKSDGERFAGGHPTESMRGDLPDKSSRVEFRLESGDRIFFNDQRKFGWVKVLPTDKVDLESLIAKLGPEVLSDRFSVEYLAAQLKRRGKSMIKPVILDQAVVGGIGNIYADETLHLAKIHPERRAGSLTPAEVKRLWAAAREVIALGIEHGGTSFSHYVNALGGKGDYLEHARVFRRQGLACPVCGTIIQKIRVGGRGTHFCPKCQPPPKPERPVAKL
jgi:formamidopyrimidine-DNA glycosylase